MAKRGYGFADRFPHVGIFLIIAVTIAIPLTVWSLNNVSTQTKQHAATCTPRPACLDAKPRCLIPITEDMCPPSVTPTIALQRCSNLGGVCVPLSYKISGTGNIVCPTGRQLIKATCGAGTVCCK